MMYRQAQKRHNYLLFKKNRHSGNYEQFLRQLSYIVIYRRSRRKRRLPLYNIENYSHRTYESIDYVVLKNRNCFLLRLNPQIIKRKIFALFRQNINARNNKTTLCIFTFINYVMHRTEQSIYSRI